jgi:hypothetical protein
MGFGLTTRVMAWPWDLEKTRTRVAEDRVAAPLLSRPKVNADTGLDELPAKGCQLD